MPEHHVRIGRWLTDPQRGAAGTVVPVTYRFKTCVPDPIVGKRIGGRYQIVSVLGEGGMGVVYKAKQDVFERLVAIKMLSAQMSEDPNCVKRFQREAKAISRLNHPNLIAVYDFGTTEAGQPFFVMEYLNGTSLERLIDLDGQVTPVRALKIMRQVCDAMDHAHRQGMIHRDLKPGNIVVLQDQETDDLVKVLDFGIVKLSEEAQLKSQRLTQTGEVWGSPVYMSPEQCMGQPLDARSDIYSLGIVFYEALTGMPPHQGKKIGDTIAKQLNEKPKPFASARPDLRISEDLQRIVFRALEKDPLRRYQSMSDFKEAIERALSVLVGQRPPQAEARSQAAENPARPPTAMLSNLEQAIPGGQNAYSTAFKIPSPEEIRGVLSQGGRPSSEAATRQSSAGKTDSGGNLRRMQRTEDQALSAKANPQSSNNTARSINMTAVIVTAIVAVSLVIAIIGSLCVFRATAPALAPPKSDSAPHAVPPRAAAPPAASAGVTAVSSSSGSGTHTAAKLPVSDHGKATLGTRRGAIPAKATPQRAGPDLKDYLPKEASPSRQYPHSETTYWLKFKKESPEEE